MHADVCVCVSTRACVYACVCVLMCGVCVRTRARFCAGVGVVHNAVSCETRVVYIPDNCWPMGFVIVATTRTRTPGATRAIVI